MRSGKTKANDLFLLMLNLSQISLREKIIDIFLEAINEIWQNITPEFSPFYSENQNNSIEISTAGSNYGFISIDNFNALETEYQDLLHNACGMLAVILRKNEHEALLADEKLHLNTLVEKRTHHLNKEIQDRKQAEQKLLESEHKLAIHLQNTPVGALSWDLHFKATDWNPAAEAMFGYSKAEALGKHVTELILPEDLKELVDGIYRDLISGKGGTRSTNENITKDGRRIICDWYNTILKDPDGKVIGAASLVQDITERKQAEDQLRIQSLVLNQIQDRVTVTDLNGIITYVNDAEVKSLGYSKEELIGKSKDKYGEDFGQGTTQQEIFEKTLKHGKWQGEVVNLTADGRRVTMDCRTQIILDDKGNKFGLVGISTDITARKQAEEEREKLQAQLNQAQKMESVGRLAGGVAHDFNNMLGVILGHAEFALEKAELGHELHADLKEIQTAAKRSANLTKQLLTFARKDIISPKKLDLNDTVEKMLTMLRRLIGEDIDLVWQPADPLWPVKMDPSQIDQILANLCVNARDAIAGVGKITIETGRKSFNEDYCSEHPGFVSGDFVLLAVSDNGCGIDKDTLDNMFEPFFTTKDVGKGTGLGLATIYGIVKQNNGFINVYSEPGQGSTFKIYLPRMVADEDTDKAIPEKKAAAGGSETILLVEDEPTILRMTRMMLERKGYSVLPAATPGEAIEIAGNHTDKIHLLMTDVVMPEMNGRDLAGQINDLYPDIKLLFMSGYTSNVIAHHGVLDDGVAFIQKPFSMADMTEKVRELLDMASDKS